MHVRTPRAMTFHQFSQVNEEQHKTRGDQHFLDPQYHDAVRLHAPATEIRNHIICSEIRNIEERLLKVNIFQSRKRVNEDARKLNYCRLKDAIAGQIEESKPIDQNILHCMSKDGRRIISDGAQLFGGLSETSMLSGCLRVLDGPSHFELTHANLIFVS